MLEHSVQLALFNMFCFAYGRKLSQRNKNNNKISIINHSIVCAITMYNAQMLSIIQ